MDVSEPVDRWVALSLAQVSERGFTQIDLDELLGDEPAAAASVGFACLERIVAAFPADSDLDALLTIPLDPGGWELPPPSLDDVLALDWSYGPGRSVPGLYVIQGMQWRLPEQVEEYKRPLDSPGLPSRFVAYYRAWRDLGESEFDRCIYVRSLPA